MKERFREEIPRWLRLLGAWRINTDSIDFNWGYFAPRAGLEFVVHRGTYFDQRWAISFALGWGMFQFYLPFKTKLPEGCDMPRYGFAVHNDTVWIYRGGDYKDGQCQNQWITWDLPWFSWKFAGHWIENKYGDWILMRDRHTDPGPVPHEFRESGAHTETYPFTYMLNNGNTQHRTAKCTVELRRWHRKWFPFIIKEQRVIDIEFNDEVGERSGSWKGGTIGCSYEFYPHETVLECLRRMEAERKF